MLKSHYALFQFLPVVDMDVAGKLGVRILVDFYYGIEKLGDALAVTAHRGADRDAKKVSQLLDIQFVTLMLELIVHIEGHDNPQVHVYELGGEVQVALYVGSINHVYDYVREGFYKVFPHVEFLRGICA